ncbi:MAG: endonuclease [Bacteroidia bacterium]|nr:MAG: endonuclease [Bacteroidia bacterium]
MLFILLGIFIAGCLDGTAQSNQYKVMCVGFYNLENMFDTIDSPNTNDGDFTPSGSKQWSAKRYRQKLHNMAEVIAKIGSEYVVGGPHVLGLSEMENRAVLEDLVKEPELLPSDYGIVHYNSPDERGIDVALLYKKKDFRVISTGTHELHFDFDRNDLTRAQLLVTGIWEGDTLHMIVNHWPSRGGGELKSRPKRNAAGDLTRHLVDSLFQINPKAKVIVMGDLNDNPDNASVKEHLNSGGKRDKLKPGQLYNPYYKVFKRGVGTTAYRDAWSLFDQLIISPGLISKDKAHVAYWKAHIFRPRFILNDEGKFKGYPKRTFSYNRFQNGYSDHFPVYLFLLKNK